MVKIIATSAWSRTGVSVRAKRCSAPFSIWARSTTNRSPRGERRWKVFDEDRQSSRNLSLFPEDRQLPEDAVDTLQVKLSGLQLRHRRASATAGWPAKRGGNWSWIISGNSGCQMDAKP
jgi:hypothetical protein